jgi:hypothetical protein
MVNQMTDSPPQVRNSLLSDGSLVALKMTKQFPNELSPITAKKDGSDYRCRLEHSILFKLGRSEIKRGRVNFTGNSYRREPMVITVEA